MNHWQLEYWAEQHYEKYTRYECRGCSSMCNAEKIKGKPPPNCCLTIVRIGLFGDTVYEGNSDWREVVQ